jgi:hypothetical protein
VFLTNANKQYHSAFGFALIVAPSIIVISQYHIIVYHLQSLLYVPAYCAPSYVCYHDNILGLTDLRAIGMCRTLKYLANHIANCF